LDKYEQLINIVGKNQVVCDKPLKNHTYTELGGTAEYFVTPVTYEQVEKVVKFANKEQIPFMLLGNGSKLIIKDGGIRGNVIYVSTLSLIRVGGFVIIAQSGALNKEVSRTALANKLKGLEFACGSPGSVGGALLMNGGAYGGEIKDVLVSAT